MGVEKKIKKKLSNSLWESSKKPLSVKTVWVSGQHHVILYQEDPIVGYLKLTGRKNSNNSSRATNATLKSKVSSATECFQIFSVKPTSSCKTLGSATSKNFSSKRPSTVSVKLSRNVLASTQIKDNNEEVLKIDEKPKENHVNLLNAFQVVSVSNGSKIDYIQNNYEKDYYHQQNLLICPNHSSNNGYRTFDNHYSLSNQVLMWLDLAIERDKHCFKRKCDKENEEFLNESKTNLHQTQNHQNNVLSRSQSYEYPSTPTDDLVKVNYVNLEMKNKQLQIEGSEIHSKKKINFNCASFSVVSHNEEIPFASPRNCNLTNYKREILKRQLHIFMPNVPKKKNDPSSSTAS